MSSAIDLREDHELVARADDDAFAELYRRHADAAWRVAMAVAGNRHDAADAVSEAFTRVFQAATRGRLAGVPFRPYLLAATRNAAVDLHRRAARVHPTHEVPERVLGAAADGPTERLVGDLDRALVAQAFADLPERWRSVLWLTEVEGMAPREAAGVLGLSANGCAQLAVRARAGLRERYLQAHVASAGSVACRFTLERLGAYVGGGLAARDVAKVDQHLAACASCREKHDELADVGSTLRRVAVPLPLFLGAAVFRRWHMVSTTHPLPPAQPRFGTVHRALAGSAASLLALGIVGAGLKGDAGSIPFPHVPPAAAEDAPAPRVEGLTIERPRAVGDLASVSTPIPSLPDALAASPAPVAPGAPAPAVGDAVTVENPAPAPLAPPADPAPTPVPLAQVDVGAGPGVASLSVGLGDGGCTGVALAGQAVGCTNDAAGSAVSVDLGGQVLPPLSLHLP